MIGSVVNGWRLSALRAFGHHMRLPLYLSSEG